MRTNQNYWPVEKRDKQKLLYYTCIIPKAVRYALLMIQTTMGCC